jgi:hypothetical protein
MDGGGVWHGWGDRYDGGKMAISKRVQPVKLCVTEKAGNTPLHRRLLRILKFFSYFW